jgi:hypothetical protein
MIIGIVLAISSGVLLAVYFVIKQRQKQPLQKRGESLARLDEVLCSTQLTNDSFFRSLELVQKNLESLLARAERAEQRMRNLMLQPGGEKRDQYTAAALLLGEGQEPRRVSSMLNLPLPQVEIVQELHRMANKDKKPMVNKKRSDEGAGREIPKRTKIADEPEKISQPVLLADILRKAANDRAAGHAQFAEAMNHRKSQASPAPLPRHSRRA